MKRNLIIAIIIVAVAALIFFTGGRKTETPPVSQSPAPLSSNMTITSSAFRHNEFIPKKYTCDGSPPAGGINPPLQISGVPENAESLVLIVDDPDAPSPPAGGWVHWLVWNINPETTNITEGTVPQGSAEGTTDFGNTDYGGPCPPSGTHRYFFKIYALDAMLNLSASAKKSDLEAAMQGHILEQTELIGLYRRS